MSSGMQAGYGYGQQIGTLGWLVAGAVQASGASNTTARELPASRFDLAERAQWNIALSGEQSSTSNFEIHALNELAPSLDVTTPMNRAIVWSNARGGNLLLADDFIAQNPSYMRLENTPGGQYLENLNLFTRYGYEQAIQPWERLSSNYASGASGEVRAFTTGSLPTSVFQRIELPILEKKADVNILYMPPATTRP